MQEPRVPLRELRAILREIAALDDKDLERLVGWFSLHINRWGDAPKSAALKIDPRAYKPTL